MRVKLVEKRVKFVETLYRPSFDKNAKIEDSCFVNHASNIYGVTDGNSAAFSPINPQDMYSSGLTGGQMVMQQVSLFLYELNFFMGIEECLARVNARVLSCHQDIGKDPRSDHDVGGASFAFCQFTEEGITFLLGGDCFALVKSANDCMFFTGFDKAAFDLEAQDQNAYNTCLNLAGGNRGNAWDLHFPRYRRKRLFCKNKNIGQGGHADLNGDPALAQCWKREMIKWDCGVKKVLLGTDGLIASSQFDGNNLEQLGFTLWHISIGDPKILLNRRDSIEPYARRSQHVEGWPEAAAVVLSF